MPLNKAIAGLSLEGPPSSRDEADDASDDRPTLGKQPSFDISGTNTFTADDLQIRGEDGVDGGGAKLSSISYASLDRVKVLGKGASGKVLLMRHSRSAEHYALKEMSAVADRDARQMAINEIRIAQKHAKACEHLVATIDAYYVDGKIGILMEYMDGGSLVEALASSRRQLPGLPALPLGPISMQMLAGLRYMHREMKQVHRDLKPANVMLSGSGVVKLSDFGVSKQLSSTDGFAMTQVGSTAYMSPERMKGEEYTYTSDVWSVGVILLEALLGEHVSPPPTLAHEPRDDEPRCLPKHMCNLCMNTCRIAQSNTYRLCLFLASQIPPCAALPDDQAQGVRRLIQRDLQRRLPPPPAGTPPELSACVEGCLRLVGRERPSVDELLACPWLGAVGKADVRQQVQQWLLAAATCAMKADMQAQARAQAEADEIAAMKAQARAMAAKAIERSAMPAADAPIAAKPVTDASESEKP